MDKRIRRNEHCIIGLPRCDFVFSSTRRCFIAYGFDQSSLEMGILRNLLEKRGIQTEEAGGSLAPGQSAFCAKICSKIITSQFCVVILNNETSDNREIPNANVNMEYGLMLGFNKYVVPFQRRSQTLPFNVAGLDTIKYSDQTLETQANQSLDQAIKDTSQDQPSPVETDQLIGAFLLLKKSLFTPLISEGDKNIFALGQPLQFNLLHDFSGMNYMFWGNFTSLRAEAVLWRIKMLEEIISDRHASLTKRIEVGIVKDVKRVQGFDNLFKNMQIWVIVTSEEDKRLIKDAMEKATPKYAVSVFSLSDVATELKRLS